jgi:hypothetical protein
MLLLQRWLLLQQVLLHLVELVCSLLLIGQHLGQRLGRSQMLQQRWLLRSRLLLLLLLQGLLLVEGLLLGGRGHVLGGRRARRRKGLRRKLLMLHRQCRLLHQRLRCNGGLRRLGWGLRQRRGLGEQDGRSRAWDWGLKQEGGWSLDWSHVRHVRDHWSCWSYRLHWWLDGSWAR